MSVRAKFNCISTKKYASTVWDKDGKKPQQGFAYSYEFQVVTGTSEENKGFYASTPSGTITIGAVRDDLFQPGKSYYVDFTPADS